MFLEDHKAGLYSDAVKIEGYYIPGCDICQDDIREGSKCWDCLLW